MRSSAASMFVVLSQGCSHCQHPHGRSGSIGSHGDRLAPWLKLAAVSYPPNTVMHGVPTACARIVAKPGDVVTGPNGKKYTKEGR